ncbi:glycosyltransferase [Aerococcaceae bacterium zg-ZJ1578]|uniref:glycosyltransferase n=1 Tax=Aerococcaceae bacterium zg-252 TaxID=2796928 RepID=UPI001A2906E0|nr:glycosyltransferase [Aerococcaceae bacterium zg-1578]
MKIIFLGPIYNPEEEFKLIDENPGGIGIASNILQLNLISSLSNEKSTDVKVFANLPVGNFPNNSNKVFYNSNTYQFKGTTFLETKTINLPFIKHKYRYLQLKKMIEEEILNQQELPIIVFYDLFKVYLDLSIWVKKLYPQIKTVFIVPDLIGNLRNSDDYSRLKNIYLKFHTRNYFNTLSKQSGLILISEYMNEIINSERTVPFLELNGVVNSLEEKPQYFFNKEKRVFMYAGNLSNQYNVKLMVESFVAMKNYNIELIICGVGQLSEWISQVSQQNSNIRFYGYVDKQKVKELEKNVDVIINPRSNNGSYTKYSFPSKNLESLLSGKPVVCFKLPPYKNKFDEVFDYIDDLSIEGFHKKINKYINLTAAELEAIGRNNYKFVVENFGLRNTQKKLLDFLSNLKR